MDQCTCTLSQIRVSQIGTSPVELPGNQCLCMYFSNALSGPNGLSQMATEKLLQTHCLKTHRPKNVTNLCSLNQTSSEHTHEGF